MRNINLDRGWSYAPGMGGGMTIFHKQENIATVNLPHDYMIANDVDANVPSGPASGYYTAGVGHYEKKVYIPEEWKKEQVTLQFDGAMMNATVTVNGCRVALQHYGYAPFEADITPCLFFGQENRICIILNPSMQPNSRWYSGAGIYRSLELVHKPKLLIANNGIYGYTKHISFREDGTPAYAFLQTQVEIVNLTTENKLAKVEVFLTKDGEEEILVSRSSVIQINPSASETAYIAMRVTDPQLWDAEHPNLYQLHARVTDIATFITHRVDRENGTVDEDRILFGIRTIDADPVHGLQINGNSVKLKGGCLHHDNGMLGAVSLYDVEYRKLSRLKEIGFNAIRTTHNPPSKALLEACDRIGMYVFDEAFDAWSIAKQPGDYSMFFDSDWEKDLTAFIKRDRSRASVIIWSTGNEITERGGLNNGYTLATKLANTVKALDASRPVSNGICSMWSGNDDFLMEETLRQLTADTEDKTGSIQNASIGDDTDISWEMITEPFTNGLDIVGYNYMEDHYARDHEMYPERIMLGSENFPKEIGFRWPVVENTPYIIGDFTWTACDYIGEAGIGKSAFLEPDDPMLAKGPMSLMSHTSPFPWRLANDADLDINGNLLPQGAYRSVIWGSDRTHVYSYSPENYGKTELLSQWGFQTVEKSWNWEGQEGRRVTVVVYSNAEEVELFVNGNSKGRVKTAETEKPDFPKCVSFDVVYEPGTVTAVSYTDGKEVSRDELRTAQAPHSLRLTAEKTAIAADGHSTAYVHVEILDANGLLVPNAAIPLTAKCKGAAVLVAFGSGNPITEENYTTGTFTTFRGKATAILRSGYETGETVVTVSADGMEPATLTITIA